MTTISNPKNSNPPYFPGTQYNPSTNNSGGSTSTQSLVSQLTPYFTKFPSVQGQLFMSDTIVNGDLIISDTNNQFVSNIDLNMNGNLLLDSSSNYIQFGDGTRQITAPSADDPNTVYNDISNTFIYPSIQTFQGSNLTIAQTGPLRFSNIDNNEFGAFSVNPNTQEDMTLYSNQPNGGFTVRNVDGNSFTMNPTAGNVCTIINPLTSTYGITGNSLTTATNLTFSTDSTVQTTAFTSSLLTPYALLASPPLTGTATLDGNTIATTNQIPSITGLAPLASPALTGSATLDGNTIATTNQIPSITGLAPLASPALTGSATFGGNPIATTNQIPSIVGLAPLASPALTGSATFGGNPIATTNQIPSIVGLAPLASPALTGIATLNGQTIATVNQITSTGIIMGTTPVLSFPSNLYSATKAQIGYFTNDIICSQGSTNFAIYIPNSSPLTPINTDNYNWFISMNQDFQFSMAYGDMQTLYGFWYYIKPVPASNLLQVVMCCSLHFNNGTNCNGLPSASFTWMAIPKTLN